MGCNLADRRPMHNTPFPPLGSGMLALTIKSEYPPFRAFVNLFLPTLGAGMDANSGLDAVSRPPLCSVVQITALRTQAVRMVLLPVVALWLVLIAIPAFTVDPQITLSPPDWDFGTLVAGNRAHGTLEVTNASARPVTVSVIPTCDCLTTGPSRISIPAGSRGRFQLTILAEEDEVGEVRESFLVQTDLPGKAFSYYWVHGTAEEPSGGASKVWGRISRYVSDFLKKIKWFFQKMIECYYDHRRREVCRWCCALR